MPTSMPEDAPKGILLQLIKITYNVYSMSIQKRKISEYPKFCKLVCLFQTKFNNAMKISQRAVREIVEQDKERIEKILHNMEAIGKALDEHYDEMQSLTVLCAKRKVPDVFGDVTRGLEDFKPPRIEVWNFDNFSKMELSLNSAFSCQIDSISSI